MIVTPSRFEFTGSMFNSAYYSPENWTRDEVNLWLTERVHEYGLDLDLPQRFPMNGRGLCMLGKDDFRRRAPDTGDVLYNSLHSLSFTPSQAKSSLARNVSDYLGVAPHWTIQAEDCLLRLPPPPAFSAGHELVPPQQAPFLWTLLDSKYDVESYDEPLNLTLAKPTPQKPYCFALVSSLDAASNNNKYERKTEQLMGASDRLDFVSSSYGRLRHSSELFRNNYPLPVGDIDRPNHPVNPRSSSSSSSASPLSVPASTAAVPSSSPSLRSSEQPSSFAAQPWHLCTALPTTSSPELPFAGKSTSSSLPVTGGSSACPAQPSSQQPRETVASDSTQLLSLASTNSDDSKTVNITQSSSSSSSSSSSPLSMHSTTAFSLRKTPFKPDNEQQQLQQQQQPTHVSTTSEETNSKLRHKMTLNLSTSDRLLWKFLSELLDCNRTKCVVWDDKQRLVFQIVDPNELAELWGEEKCKPGMTYEKLSRALRYYYKMNILEKVPGKRLTYRFLTSPQLIKKGKRGAKPGVPHKRRNCVETPSNETKPKITKRN